MMNICDNDLKREMSIIPSFSDMENLESKYKGWKRGISSVFREIGHNNDWNALDLINRSLLVSIPYTEVAIGAATKGHIDMTLDALERCNGSCWDIIYRIAKKNGYDDILIGISPYVDKNIYLD